MREECLDKVVGFTFETVLSTDRNLNLLKRAKAKGYFIRCIYTSQPFRLFKKRKEQIFYWTNQYWNKDRIENLVGRSLDLV